MTPRPFSGAGMGLFRSGGTPVSGTPGSSGSGDRRAGAGERRETLERRAAAAAAEALVALCEGQGQGQGQVRVTKADRECVAALKEFGTVECIY